MGVLIRKYTNPNSNLAIRGGLFGSSQSWKVFRYGEVLLNWAEGFHFWDDRTNKKNFSQIVNSLFRFVKNPQRALLVGSKDLEGNPYSIEQFQRLKKVFLERIKDVTLFEKHNFDNAQTHYHYSLKDDTWTLFSEYRKSDNGRYHTVKDLKSLKECFENISIAEGDKLFLNGKEIKISDAPEIFVTKKEA